MMMSTGYVRALEAAGAEVLAYREFSEYEGTAWQYEGGAWTAKVTYRGDTGYVFGLYGHYPNGDAFDNEFGDCIDNVERLREFGESYLSDIKTQEEAEELAAEYADWDGERKDMLDWVINRAIEVSSMNDVNDLYICEIETHTEESKIVARGSFLFEDDRFYFYEGFGDGAILFLQLNKAVVRSVSPSVLHVEGFQREGLHTYIPVTCFVTL